MDAKAKDTKGAPIVIDLLGRSSLIKVPPKEGPVAHCQSDLCQVWHVQQGCKSY